MIQPTRLWTATASMTPQFISVQTLSGYGGMSMVDPLAQEHILPPDVDDLSLGLAVKQALAHSRWVLGSSRPDMSDPPGVEFDADLYDLKKGKERYNAWTDALMQRFSLKTKRALFKDMHKCHLSAAQDVLKIEPQWHAKLEGWARERDDGIEDVIIAANSSPEEIGAALRLAFTRCE